VAALTLSDLASIASIISSLAVAGSLIYLGIQTHLSAKQARAATAQSRTARAMEWCFQAAQPDIAAAMVVGNGGTPTEEVIRAFQFRCMSTANIYSADETFSQHEAGLYDGHQLGTMRGSIEVAMKAAAYRAVWEEWKAGHPAANPRFLVFMDELADAGAKASESAS
jgi:hypothetical protein